MRRRKLTLGVVVAGLAVGLASLVGASSARADEPVTISPAVYRNAGMDGNGANIQLVRHYYGGGYGWGGGYRGGYYGGYGPGYYGGYGGGVGIGLYAPVYRRYPGFGTPVYAAPVYAPPIYGYPAGGYGYGYPAYGYGCW